MLSSHLPSVKDTHFTHSVLTKIHGKPVYDTLRLLADEVKANAAAVPTTLGGGSYGHLGLVLSAARYAALPLSAPWVTPVNPGNFTSPAGATGPQIEAARDMYRQRLRTYELFQATEKALIAQVVEAIDTIYLRAKWNRATGQYTGSIRAILLHLFTTYGKITPMDVQVKEQAVSNMAYAIMQPVDVVFDAIEDLADLAETGLSPIPSQKMVDMAYLILAKEPLFRQDLLQWNRRPTAEKTWANMMEHFRDAQTDMNSLPTAGDVYHQHHGNANSVIAIADLVAQRLLDAANAADASAPPDAVLPTANAVIADRGDSEDLLGLLRGGPEIALVVASSMVVIVLIGSLIAPILLALSFDSILSLNARIKRKKKIADLLFGRVALCGVMVDFGAQQRRHQQWIRLRRRQRKQRRRIFCTKKTNADTAALPVPSNDCEEEKSHDFQPSPPPRTSERATSIQGAFCPSEPDLQDPLQDPFSDPLQDYLQGPAEVSQEQSEFLQDETESVFSESIFGPFAHPPEASEEDLFGLPDGAEVSKSEFVLSVMLYLGKLRYESDVYVWCKVR